MTANDEYILEILESVGLITHKQGVQSLETARQEDKSVTDILVGNAVVSKLDILKALANQFGMDTLSLTGLDIPQDVVDLVPGDVARRYKIMPVFKNNNTLTVALSDPLDVETLDGLRYILKTNVEGVVSPMDEIGTAINQYYGRTGPSVESMMQEITEGAVRLPEGATEYVNSMWKIQENPFGGDAVNSYNDGPPGGDKPQLGRFYELETSSPALALKSGGIAKHTQRTIHLQGSEADLDPIARAIFGIGIEDIKNGLKK